MTDGQGRPATVAPTVEAESRPEPNPPLLDPTELASAIQDFRLWTTKYAAAKAAGERQALLATGKGLAVAHRQAIRQLIPVDPRRALEQAVPVGVRQQLPAEILSQIEARINTRGWYRVIAVWPGASEPPIRRLVETDGKRYQAHVYGRWLRQPTTEQAFLSGIAVDRLLALDERPLRVLEPGELPDAAKPVIETCPVCGESTGVPRNGNPLPPLGAATTAVEAGGVIYYPCAGGHIREFERQLILLEGGTGGPIVPTGSIPATMSTGVKTILYLRVCFPETRLDPQTETVAYDMMRQVNDWYVEVSYGNFYLLTTVAPLIILPHTEAFYNGIEGDEFGLYSDALVAAAAMGYDYSTYDLDIVAYTGGPGNFNGAASVGGRGIWLKSKTVGTTVHELGHNLGLYHANFWDPGGRSVIGDGSHVEYGNTFDTMGPASAGNLHFNVAFKHQLDWLKKELVHDIHRSGVYRIHAYDQSRLDPANCYGFKVRKDSERSYWGEFRQKFGASNPWLRDGVLLNWSSWSKSAGGTHLLDTTPGTPDGRTDAALTIGRTLSDSESGVHITPVGKGGTSPESIDVIVNLGTFPDNQSPTATVSADQTSVGPGVTVNFTATVTDPEGDTLACFWDFGDKTFSNDNSIGVAKSWSAAGDYVVRCLVSDMKGGTASDSVIVCVGSPATFTISGQVTSGGEPLANARVHNGQSGANYRGAYTDTDGQYTVTGLSAGSMTVSAALYGYSLTAAFANPVTVGPSFSGANFTAALMPRVTITATDPAATEGSDPGTFTIARTGSTASTLTVAVLAPSGTASSGDYTLSPAAIYSGGNNNWYQFTIPAGQPSCAITLSAVADGSSEGPETATLELLPTASYVIAGPGSATVTIQDADTTLPLVGIRVLDADSSEAGDSATFVVSRTGPTGSPLTVNFTRSGTAINGTDYSDIGTSVIIAAGQSSANIAIAPIQDTAIEGDEDVIITLSASGTYLLDFSAQSASAFIVDDDVPTLTIYATDATASESGQDPATFVITRTGDTSAPLTVNYALAGSAHHGVDYAMLLGVLTIPAGSSAGSITIVPIDDDVGEPSQTISVQIRGGTGYAVGNPANAITSILDNDVPVVTVGVSDGTFGETNGTGQIKFTTTGSGSGNITVHYTVSGTATPGLDYVALPGTLSMGKNTTATVTVTPLDDSDPEGTETVTVTIDPDADYTHFLDQTATLNLLDNEGIFVDVTPGSTYFDEGNDTVMIFHITRQGSTANPLAVHYTMGGTASNGVDYTDYFSHAALSGLLTIPAGQSGADIWAVIVNDSLAEGTETVTLTITPDPAYGLGIASVTQYLPDNEVPALSVRFTSSTGSGSENVGTVNIPVTLSAASATLVTVEYAIAGGSATGGIDYNLATGVIAFAPGVTAMSIPLTIIDDSFDEPAQTVILELKHAWNAALGTGTHTYTINDNDSPPSVTVGFAATASAASENVSPAILLVSLTATQAVPVTVHYAPTGGTAAGGGVDYMLAPGTLTFAPGDTVKALPITINDDTLYEPNETIVVTLDSPSGASLNANTAHTYVILDNEAGVSVASSGVTSEDGLSNGEFLISRSGYMDSALSVNLAVSGTAGNGQDFSTIPSAVVLPAGSSLVRVAVLPMDDLCGEGTETVSLTLLSGTGYTVLSAGNATVSLLDNDGDTPPIITAATATEVQPYLGAVDVKACAHVAVQGTVNFSVQANAPCSLTGHPTVGLTNGAAGELAGFVDENPPGTFNYTWPVTPATANGTWTATVTAADSTQATTAAFAVCVDTTQITGQVELEGFVGTGTVPAHTRSVTFVATGGSATRTWSLPLANDFGATFNYTLTEVPPGTTHLSAKTDWNLRRKLAVTLTNAQGVANFSAGSKLLGGDINTQGTSHDNIVNGFDRTILLGNWFKPAPGNATADINGDGNVNGLDRTRLLGSWFKSGDPE